MNPLELEFAADFLIYFLKHSGVAVIVATPAIFFLIFCPPSKWRN
jgi:hypothetical protein